MGKKSEILPNLFWDSIPLTTKDAGVYGIINRADGRIYIGGSQNLSARRGTHKFDIRHRRHAVKLLQDEIILDPPNFEFVVIEIVNEISEIVSREQFWLDFYQSYLPDKGYNRCRRADSILGFKHNNPELSARMSAVRIVKKHPPRSEQSRARYALAKKGKRAPHCHKPVIQMDLNGLEIKRFDCISDAALAVRGKSGCGLLVRVLKSGRPDYTAYGYKWKYA